MCGRGREGRAALAAPPGQVRGHRRAAAPKPPAPPPSPPLSHPSSSPSDSGRRRCRVLPADVRERQNSHIAERAGGGVASEASSCVGDRAAPRWGAAAAAGAAKRVRRRRRAGRTPRRGHTPAAPHRADYPAPRPSPPAEREGSGPPSAIRHGQVRPRDHRLLSGRPSVSRGGGGGGGAGIRGRETRARGAARIAGAAIRRPRSSLVLLFQVPGRVRARGRAQGVPGHRRHGRRLGRPR